MESIARWLGPRLAACWYGPVAGWVFIGLGVGVGGGLGCVTDVDYGAGVQCGWSAEAAAAALQRAEPLMVAASIVFVLQLVAAKTRFALALAAACLALAMGPTLALEPGGDLAAWLSEHVGWFSSLAAAGMLTVPSSLLLWWSGLHRLAAMTVPGTGGRGGQA